MIDTIRAYVSEGAAINWTPQSAFLRVTGIPAALPLAGSCLAARGLTS